MDEVDDNREVDLSLKVSRLTYLTLNSRHIHRLGHTIQILQNGIFRKFCVILDADEKTPSFLNAMLQEMHPIPDSSNRNTMSAPNTPQYSSSLRENLHSSTPGAIMLIIQSMIFLPTLRINLFTHRPSRRIIPIQSDLPRRLINTKPRPNPIPQPL